MRSLCLVFILCSCSDAWADKHRRAGARARGALTRAAVSSGFADYVKDPYSCWFLTYEGPAFTGATWPSTVGSVNTTSDGTNEATADGSTSGLTDAALGSFSGEAVEFAVQNRYDNTGGLPAISDGDNIWIRALVKFGTLVNGDWLWDWTFNATNGMYMTTRSAGGGTLRTDFFLGHGAYRAEVSGLSTGQWYLVDAYHRDLGSDGDATVYINGTANEFANSGLAPVGIVSGGQMDILGENSSATAFALESGALVFLGFCSGTDELINETNHDRDCEQLGLCP